jgi:cytochrome P450
MSSLPEGPRGPRMVQAWFWLKRPVWFLDHCQRRYGHVFTMRMPFSTDLVHVADPELVKAVFGGDHEVLRAGEANGMFLEPLVGPHSVLVLDGPEHLRQRKLILPAFHGDRMRGWEDAIRDITRAQVARWPVGTPFALRPSMQSITLDVIIRVIFGVDGTARADDLRRRILTISRLGRSPLLLYATANRRLGPRAPWPRFLRAREELSAALVAEIRERRRAADLTQRGDVLSQLLLARDEAGAAMTDDEVSDELITLLFAGHETTATALAWAFDLLLHHRAALGRLAAELEDGGSEYLEATIKETLRVRPVVALVDRRVRQATAIGGHTIPAGALLCPNVYLAQRREDLYPDPAAFRPERFIGQPPPSFGWFPFGGGLRRCIGASFATFEMQIVIPEVLRAVTLRPASPRPARVRREAVTFVPHDGARCVVTARRGVDARAGAGLGLPSKRLVIALEPCLEAARLLRRARDEGDERDAGQVPVPGVDRRLQRHNGRGRGGPRRAQGQERGPADGDLRRAAGRGPLLAAHRRRQRHGRPG